MDTMRQTGDQGTGAAMGVYRRVLDSVRDDAATVGRSQYAWSAATPEQQRVIAGALIQWVLVGPGGKPLQPVLRSS
jgi:hypothetical protein